MGEAEKSDAEEPTRKDANDMRKPSFLTLKYFTNCDRRVMIKLIEQTSVHYSILPTKASYSTALSILYSNAVRVYRVIDEGFWILCSFNYMGSVEQN